MNSYRLADYNYDQSARRFRLSGLWYESSPIYVWYISCDENAYVGNEWSVTSARTHHVQSKLIERGCKVRVGTGTIWYVVFCKTAQQVTRVACICVQIPRRCSRVRYGKNTN